MVNSECLGASYSGARHSDETLSPDDSRAISGITWRHDRTRIAGSGFMGFLAHGSCSDLSHLPFELKSPLPEVVG